MIEVSQTRQSLKERFDGEVFMGLIGLLFQFEIVMETSFSSNFGEIHQNKKEASICFSQAVPVQSFMVRKTYRMAMIVSLSVKENSIR